MTADERVALLDTLVGAGVDPARMMPGTGCCSINDTVRLSAHAVKHGCAGVLMLPPFYYKDVSEEGLYRYFSEVVERLGDPRLRIYLYHIPPVAIVGITLRLVERLLSVYPANIAGMKDSSGDWSNTKAFLDAFAPHGFDVFVGSETFLLAAMRNRGAGCISATANVNPAAIHRLYRETNGIAQESRNTGREAELQQRQDHLNVVREVFAKSGGSMIAALKETIAIHHNDPEWARVRPPLLGLTSEQAEALQEKLTAIRFAMT
jgi:4-hydroxy-tetrahydrodipicolinate synthase